ncbi:MAG: hypothetical protein GX638_01650 [Crenarchaeota archaeon]|nr:hypothetical protein [Thermoproteota archaeon]
MSEAVKFSTNELYDWLQKEAGHALVPVQAQAQKRLDEVRINLDNLTEASKMLIDSSQKEIEKRNMKVYNRARALHKLATGFIDRIKKLSLPDKISYDNLSVFVDEAKKTIFVTELDIKNWFPHISPFFIMDRRKFSPVFEKTKNAINSLNDFVTKEYVKTKTHEKTFQLLTELQTFETQLKELVDQKNELKNNLLTIENETTAKETQIVELKNNSIIDQLCQIETQQEILNNELKNLLRHFQKPFIKMQALATSGGGAGITSDNMKKLTQYIDDPFEAIITEKPDLPMLKEVVEKLQDLLHEDKLKLKPDKQRKAEQSIEDVLRKNMLDEHYSKCCALANQKKLLSNSSELEKTKISLSQSQEEFKKLQLQKANLETEEALKTNGINEMLDKIANHKKIIEANIQGFLGKQVKIV